MAYQQSNSQDANKNYKYVHFKLKIEHNKDFWKTTFYKCVFFSYTYVIPFKTLRCFLNDGIDI